MNADRSALIDTLLERLEPLPPSEWDAVLEQATGDPELRAQVRARLTQDDDPPHTSGGLLGPVIGGVAALWTQAQADSARGRLIGRRAGAYAITGIIGQGGMGAVYRARRADGQFEQDVAIKIVRHGFETPSALERFRQERQILARLSHPAIARLLDGGTITDEIGGEIPYLVLEYVDGLPITTYCDAHPLSIAGRVKLFRLVCDAVQHAHQHLIVHRDLKPGNILIASGGQPKLLDFGIAKLLFEHATPLPALSATESQLMTPEYASPEQVRAEPVTAATDVYSLGAVLYELLTGQKAHQFQTRSPVEIGRVICDTETTRPSVAVTRTTPSATRLRRQLEGDLDTIVLKAMRKEPSRRYTSVEQLSEDLRRHLDGLPVLARPDTATYRAHKFLRRHVVGVTATLLLVLSLAGGWVSTAVQARARAAEALRAERRFQQVRQLANTFLFEVHDKIKDLPGATDARETMVRTGLQYLDSLSREAGGDASLQMELAEAYKKVGDVQYDVRRASLGRAAPALESYRKALALNRELAAREPASPRYQRLLAETSLRTGLLVAETGDHATGVDHIRQGLRAAQAALAADPGDAQNTFTILEAYDALGTALLATRDLPAVLASFRSGLAAVEQLASRLSDDRVQRGRARTYNNIGTVLVQMGDLTPAAEHFRRALNLWESLAERHPSESSYQMDLMFGHQTLGDLLGSPVQFSLGDPRAAEGHYRRAVALGEKLADADSKDSQTRFRLSTLYRKLGHVATETNPRQAVDFYERSAAIVAQLLAASPENVNYARQQAMTDLYRANAWRALGNRGAAMTSAQQALAAQRALLASSPTRQTVRQDMLVTYNVMGDVRVDDGDLDAARASYQQALEVAESVLAAAPADEYARRDLTDCYERLGRLSARQAVRRDLPAAQRVDRWREARAWHQKSLAIWRDWAGPTNLYVTRRRDQVARAVAECDTALAKLAR